MRSHAPLERQFVPNHGSTSTDLSRACLRCLRLTTHNHSQSVLCSQEEILALQVSVQDMFVMQILERQSCFRQPPPHTVAAVVSLKSILPTCFVGTTNYQDSAGKRRFCWKGNLTSPTNTTTRKKTELAWTVSRLTIFEHPKS